MYDIHPPQFLPLKDLLEGRLFHIPLYQRAYSWSSAERNDMFEDILFLKKNLKETHFMSTVVGLRKCQEPVIISEDEYSDIWIVDGQQRLTTLVILLKIVEKELGALLKLTDEDRVSFPPKPELKETRQKLVRLLVKSDDFSLLLLQRNQGVGQYFESFIRGEGTYPDVSEAQSLADQQLLEAFSDCESFVQDNWKNPIELLRILRNRLWFIYHETRDELGAYRIFEVLNNRGLTVSSLDILKNRLMEVVFEEGEGNQEAHIEELHGVWGDFYRTVYKIEAIRQHRNPVAIDALGISATLRPGKRRSIQSDKRVVDSLMKEVGRSVLRTREISDWLLKVAQKIEELESEMKPPITTIRQARLLAVAIKLCNLPAEDERKLLDQWEKTTFRIYCLCNNDARTAVGDYVGLACEILDAEDINCDAIIEKIRRIATSHSAVNEFDVWTIDFYTEQKWRERLRYLLYRYEEHLAKENGQSFSNEQWNRIWKESDANTIEHIVPQSKADQIYVHQIGNLLLLPPRLNSKLSDKDPKDKVDAYKKTGLLIAIAAAEWIESCMVEVEAENRNYNIIDAQTHIINDWIIDEFGT